MFSRPAWLCFFYTHEGLKASFSRGAAKGAEIHLKAISPRSPRLRVSEKGKLFKLNKYKLSWVERLPSISAIVGWPLLLPRLPGAHNAPCNRS